MKREKKLDFSKIRKNSRNYQDMTDEQRTQWNEYQKLKQREYRAKRKAERNALEDNAAGGNVTAPKLDLILEDAGKQKKLSPVRLFIYVLTAVSR